jgi:hypothetical protein
MINKSIFAGNKLYCSVNTNILNISHDCVIDTMVDELSKQVDSPVVSSVYAQLPLFIVFQAIKIAVSEKIIYNVKNKQRNT